MQKRLTLEQEICVLCGFCCDGTLFSHAALEQGERGNLPPKLERQYAQYDDQEYFRQPCPYFAGCCTIYAQPKPKICSSFRCKLLRNIEAQVIMPERAVQTVHDASHLRADIYSLYEQTFGQDAPADFISLRNTVSQVAQTMPVNDPARNSIDRLTIKCVMLDYLLTKEFKPSGRSIRS